MWPDTRYVASDDGNVNTGDNFSNRAALVFSMAQTRRTELASSASYRLPRRSIQKRWIAAASGLTNVKSFPEVAAWRRADPFARPEYFAQTVHIGAGGEDDRTFKRFVDVRIGLQMRDQLGIGVDGVTNARRAKHLDFDRWRICTDPKICGFRRPADHRQRKHQEVDGANSKSPYPGRGWMPPNHGEEPAKAKRIGG